MYRVNAGVLVRPLIPLRGNGNGTSATGLIKEGKRCVGSRNAIYNSLPVHYCALHM